MSPPVWFRLSELTGDARYKIYAHHEYQITRDLLFDEEAGLFYRDDRFIRKRGRHGEKIFWSRGNGWVFAGLTSIIDALEYDDRMRAYYVALFKEMAASLIRLQLDGGTWPMSLHGGRFDTTPETSGTGFFVAGLAWGVNSGLLTDDASRDAIKKGWAALKSAQQDDGMIGWVQQIGAAPGKVRADHTQFYGIGAFLLAAKEVYEMAAVGGL